MPEEQVLPESLLAALVQTNSQATAAQFKATNCGKMHNWHALCKPWRRRAFGWLAERSGYPPPQIKVETLGFEWKEV